MKILLPIDPPEVNGAALTAVEKRPWPPGSTVEVLSVVEPTYVMDVPSLVEGLQEAAGATVQSAAERLRSAGLDVATRVLCGDAKTVIVDRASQMGADFVMLGSRGASGITRFLLGSVANAVARFAPCSVEIVRSAMAGAPPSPGLKILLATDGSECSQIAARSIAERPWPKGTVVRVLSVAELSIPLLRMPYFSATAMEKLREDSMRRAEEAEMAAEEVLADVGLDESGTVAVPVAAAKEVILQNAEEWGASLIVCGSHGRHGLNRFLLGSVSEAVASHAKCSVEIVRKTAA